MKSIVGLDRINVYCIEYNDNKSGSSLHRVGNVIFKLSVIGHLSLATRP